MRRYFAELLEEFGMSNQPVTGDKRSLYSTCYSSIIYLHSIGIPDSIIVEFTGRSLEMICKHYSQQRVIALGFMFKYYMDQRTR